MNSTPYRSNYKYQSILFLSISCLFFALTACLPIPTKRQPLDVPSVEFEVSPASVFREFVFVEGFQEPHTPSDYNGSLVSKYTRTTKRNTPSRTIFVLVPGIYAGATTLEPLARQLVAADSSIEAWVIDRRSNLLEDTDVIAESIRTQDVSFVYDYYIKNYGTEAGFTLPNPSDVSFMQYWGLDLHLFDLHEVIKQANAEADEVYLLGHSLGASVISFYSAFKVGEGKSGEDYLDGLILLDGVLGRTGGFDGIQWFNGLLDIAPEISDGIVTSDTEDGLLNLQSLTGFNTYLPIAPQEHSTSAVLAVLARFDPEGQSPLYKFPITNRAAFGGAMDDSFERSTVFGASVGEIRDAELAGNLLAVLLDGDIGIYSKSIVGVAEGADRVTWDTTLQGREVCDIDSFVANHSNEFSNYNEWYFPVELMLDIAGYDMLLRDIRGFKETSDVRVPTLAFAAERGLVQDLDIFSAYSNLRAGSLISSYLVDDFTHLDIMCAEVNPVTTIVLRWLEQLRTLRQNR